MLRQHGHGSPRPSSPQSPPSQSMVSAAQAIATSPPPPSILPLPLPPPSPPPSLVRELLLRAKVCKSSMSVDQKHFNFGRILSSESRTKTVGLKNHSMTPLFYKISKTGSISSGFLKIVKRRMGVIRPFGSGQLEFVLQPSLPGRFEESGLLFDLTRR